MHPAYYGGSKSAASRAAHVQVRPVLSHDNASNRDIYVDEIIKWQIKDEMRTIDGILHYGQVLNNPPALESMDAIDHASPTLLYTLHIPKQANTRPKKLMTGLRDISRIKKRVSSTDKFTNSSNVG